MRIKNLDIKDFIKEGLKESSFENYLNPRNNLGGSDRIGAPSKLAKSLIEERVEVIELLIEATKIAKLKGYENIINTYKAQIRKLKGKENYQTILEECWEDKRKAIEEHKRYFS